MAETQSIDADNKIISTSIGELTYDILIITTGATSNYFGMDNIQKHTWRLPFSLFLLILQ